jgi:RimJ/RimL family protein N-acetyltransferase
LLDTGSLIGMVEMRIRDHKADLGYGLAHQHWGRGYMTEALSPLMEWAIGQESIYRLWAVCDVENERSARLLERLGMKREGVLRRWLMHPNVSHEPRDCYCYALVKE